MFLKQYLNDLRMYTIFVSHLTQELQHETGDVGGQPHCISHKGGGGHLVILLPVPEEPHQVYEGEGGQSQRQETLADAKERPWNLSAPGGSEAA